MHYLFLTITIVNLSKNLRTCCVKPEHQNLHLFILETFKQRAEFRKKYTHDGESISCYACSTSFVQLYVLRVLVGSNVLA